MSCNDVSTNKILKLQIFDGIYREDSLLKEYCNNSEDDLTLGSTNEMILKLVSSGLHSHVNFSGKVIPSGGNTY